MADILCYCLFPKLTKLTTSPWLHLHFWHLANALIQSDLNFVPYDMKQDRCHFYCKGHYVCILKLWINGCRPVEALMLCFFFFTIFTLTPPPTKEKLPLLKTKVPSPFTERCPINTTAEMIRNKYMTHTVHTHTGFRSIKNRLQISVGGQKYPE